MMTTPDTSRHDDAARAIREALPTPDAAATDRIARRIAEVADADANAQARLARRGPRITGGRGWKPLFAAGVACCALAIAMLAPSNRSGGDEASSPFALGPDIAAADALHTAGDAAAAAPWTPLRPGEYHYTRSVSEELQMRIRVIEERWLAADGSGRIRRTTERLGVPRGAHYFVPAEACMTPELLGTEPLDAMTDLTGFTLTAGEPHPACWSDPINNSALTTAVGPIVDAPPVGALVEPRPGFAPGGSHALRFGETLIESAEPSAVPPGNGTSMTSKVGSDNPIRVRPSTTWVEVVSAPTVSSDERIEPGQPAMDTSVNIGFVDWVTAIGAEHLDELPTTGSELLVELRAIVARERALEDRRANAKEAALFRPSVDIATMQLALQLLTNAPLDPPRRRAAFDALALFDGASDAVLTRRDATDDAGDVLGVELSFDAPRGYEDPSGRAPTLTVLLDRETAQLRGTELDFDSRSAPYVTTYAPTRRVDSLQDPR